MKNISHVSCTDVYCEIRCFSWQMTGKHLSSRDLTICQDAQLCYGYKVCAGS